LVLYISPSGERHSAGACGKARPAGRAFSARQLPPRCPLRNVAASYPREHTHHSPSNELLSISLSKSTLKSVATSSQSHSIPVPSRRFPHHSPSSELPLDPLPCKLCQRLFHIAATCAMCPTTQVKQNRTPLIKPDSNFIACNVIELRESCILVIFCARFFVSMLPKVRRLKKVAHLRPANSRPGIRKMKAPL